MGLPYGRTTYWDVELSILRSPQKAGQQTILASITGADGEDGHAGIQLESNQNTSVSKHILDFVFLLDG